ncbi:MAG TPA: hypothetical protein VFO86_04470, partial [Terriglobia bacterium]|nr:hypothetical protein [Terriglobia bacterium]
MKLKYTDTTQRILIVLMLVVPLAGADQWAVGLSGSGTKIDASVVPGASPTSPTVLVIGGLSGEDASTSSIRLEVRAFESLPKNRRTYQLIAIPLANPDRATLHFPPTGTAYREDAESHALWRWIGIHAPDFVVVAAN